MTDPFYPVRQFIAARGPCFDMDRDSPRYKLCVVATDLEYLIEFLTRVVTRPDGYYVKYSPEPKDGMYLGRVYLDTADAVGKLWADVKNDAKLIASVQDDHFIYDYRDPELLAKAIANGE